MSAVTTEMIALHSQKPQQRGPWRVILKVLTPVAAPLLLIIVWEAAARGAQSIWFPPPTEILGRMRELWFSGPAPFFLTPAVADDVLPSIARMFAGLGIAIVIGVLLGIVIGRSRFVSTTTEPIINFLRSTPGPALLPVFLLLLGTDSMMRIALIAFASLWPILLNTIDGVRSVEATQLETAKLFGLPAWARVTRVILPSALPKILAGVTISIAVALTLMVVSELSVATDGIGFQIQRATQLFEMTDMWAGILLIAILGIVLNAIFEIVERISLRWYRGSKRKYD